PISQTRIQDVIKEGHELIIQVEKEERGNKGTALTTFISLAGRYLVLMPNNPRAGGISRRVEGDERSELRDALSQLTLPEGMGLIVRTAGVGQSAEELQWDLDYLLQLWGSIDEASGQRPSPFLVFQESNIIIRAIRDYFRADINEILIDSEEVYNQAHEFMSQVMPRNVGRVKHYDDTVPLFSRYQIESKIEAALGHSVRLPSGGSIVIDHTEALVSIDINSARATKGSDIEETAFNTNLEAADEIARQLRIRDLGGLIVIDFIDMTPNRNQREVENRLREALELDRARVQVGRISRFGLLEMSRQRLRPSLSESSLQICPRCKGQGTVRSHESLALSVLRVMEEEAIKDRTERILAKVPVAIATYLLNEKRSSVAEIEARHEVRLLIIPDENMEAPHYEIDRVRDDDQEHVSRSTPSYELPTQIDPAAEFLESRPSAPVPEPAVKSVPPPARAPTVQPTAGPGLISRLLGGIFAKKEPEVARAAPERAPASSKSSTENREGQGQARRGQGRSNNEQRRRGGQQRRGSGGSNRRGSQSRGADENRDGSGGRQDRDRARTQKQGDAAAPAGERKEQQTANNTSERGPVQPRRDGRDDSGNGAPRSRSGRGRRGRRGGRNNSQRNAENGKNNANDASRNGAEPNGNRRPETPSRPAEANGNREPNAAGPRDADINGNRGSRSGGERSETSGPASSSSPTARHGTGSESTARSSSEPTGPKPPVNSSPASASSSEPRPERQGASPPSQSPTRPTDGAVTDSPAGRSASSTSTPSAPAANSPPPKTSAPDSPAPAKTVTDPVSSAAPSRAADTPKPTPSAAPPKVATEATAPTRVADAPKPTPPTAPTPSPVTPSASVSAGGSSGSGLRQVETKRPTPTSDGSGATGGSESRDRPTPKDDA
ncbi:MAG: Rne/Rng family ribonuclease, partial [Gammaproteobacteria bacterium]|nr:Rne/Rng family ribonuclease [Gammaproteobacteria bacterium]